MCGVAFGQDVGTGRGGRGAGAQKGRCINRGEPNGSFRWGGGSGRGRADVQAGWRAPCVGSMTCPWSRADAHLVEVIGEPVAQGGRRATRRGLAHLTTADSSGSLLLNLESREPPTDAPRAVPRRRSRPVERGVCVRRGCRCARAPFVASGNVRSCPGPLSGSLGGFGIFPLCSSLIDPANSKILVSATIRNVTSTLHGTSDTRHGRHAVPIRDRRRSVVRRPHR